MSFTKTAMVVTVGSVLSCCVLGGLGAVVSRPDGSTTTEPASRSGDSPAPGAAAAPVVPALSAEELAAVAAALDEAATDSRSKLDRRDYVGAARALDSARGRLEALPAAQASDPRLAGARGKVGELEQAFGALLPTARALARAQGALDADRADVVARYDGLVAARQGLPEDAGAPRELASALSRTRRELDRAIAHDEDAAYDARLAQRIREQGLVRVEARRLADEFRTNEVAAENAYKGRRLAVEGTVSEVRTDAFGHAIVDLATSNMFMPVNAEVAREVAARLERRDRVVLACECEGMVIGHPQLDECTLLAVWR